MSLLKALFSPSKEVVWRQLAKQVEGRFVEGGFFGTDVVQARTGDWIITLDTYVDSNDDTTYTRLRAPYVNPEGFVFTIYRTRFFTGLNKLFGMQDIEVGYARFDDDYVIQGNSEHRVRKFFENERIRELIDGQPKVHLQVRDDEGWFKARFPDGVDELRFQCKGVVKDLGQLESLFELFTESLNQLCHDGKAYEDDVNIHLRRLRGPGGRIEGKHLLWQGDPPRHDAATALGRLKDPKAIDALASVLASDDAVLRAHAINALASIAHPLAIGPLVRLLGDRSGAAGKRIQDRAADALRSLGEAELVDVVLAALSGDASRLRDTVGGYRAPVIDGFVNALEGASAIHAAKALEEIHAMEALPGMRVALRHTGTKSPKGAAIQASIQELEARAALPRPAEGRAVGADTLPRVADDPGPTTEPLPRVAEDRGPATDSHPRAVKNGEVGEA